MIRFPSFSPVAAAAVLFGLFGCGGGGGSGGSPGPGGGPNGGDGGNHLYTHGTITFATNEADYWYPTHVVSFDLATDGITTLFQGIDPHRTKTGETAYMAYIGGDYTDSSASYGVTVADARGVPGPAIYITEGYGFNGDENCQTPRLSPYGDRVAFGIVGGGGQYCVDGYGMYWSSFVVVRERATGRELARFEGYYHPEWLPNGDLLMMGAECEEANIMGGLWITDDHYSPPRRIDGGKITTPAFFPTVNPMDPNRVLLVWNGQLWQITLDDDHILTQLTQFTYPVTAATWSPDGTTLAVLQWEISLPIKSILFFKPGDDNSVEVRQLPSYPRGPLSWN
jgi:hypothetical protein